MKYLIMLLFLSFPLIAEDNLRETLIKALSSEDFDIRDRATRELCKAEVTEIDTFYKMSKKYEKIDVETADRLLSVCANLNAKKSLKENPKVLGILGTLDASFTSIYLQGHSMEFLEKLKNTLGHYPVYAFKATWVATWGTSKNDIKEGDIVVSITQGKTSVNDYFRQPEVQVGKEYKCIIMRFDPESADSLSRNDCVNEDKPYEMVVVTVRAVQKEKLEREEEVNLEFLLHEDWLQYMANKEAQEAKEIIEK